MNLPLPTPTSEQEEILSRVKNRENLLVIAGAGTGKTTSLLFIYRALLECLCPSKIVAITFTEKAAGELRDGIRALLTSDFGDRPSSRFVRDAASALIALSDAPIGTIHSFCARIAREFPEVSGLPPEFKVLDEAGASFHLDRALTQFVNNLLSSDPLSDEFFRLLEYKDYRPAGVRDLIRRIFTLMRQKHLKRQDLAAIYCEENSGEFGKHAGEGVSRETLSSGGSLADIILSYSERFRDCFQERRFADGYVDFEDLLEGASRIVSDDALAKVVSARYPAVLVDEFQDTDRLQDYIVQRLKAFGSQVIFVGDPLQSIYGFRGADVRVFTDLIQNAQSKGFCVCNLSLNFRSGQGILNLVNASVGRAQAPVLLSGKRRKDRRKSKEPEPLKRIPLLPPGEYTHLRASDACKPATVVVFRRVQCGGLDSAREKEAKALPAQCQWISAEYGIPAGQIAVLFRKFTHIDIYSRFLEEAGLPYFAHSGGGLFASQEVMDVLSLLRWVADPADRIAEAAVLRSPLCGLDDASLVAWLSPEGVAEGYKPAADAWSRARRVTDLVARLRRRALTASPALVTQELLSDTHFGAQVLRLPGGVRRAANLSAFVDRLFQLEAQMGWTFREMVEFVSRLSDDESGASPPPLDIEDPRTVKLLTVHAAKGLEFEAVILADTRWGAGASHEPQYDPDSRVLFIDKPDERAEGPFTEAHANIVYAEFQENLRLLYVAMTRAKRILGVNWYVRHNKTNLSPEQPIDFSRLLSLLHGEPVESDDGGGSEALLRIVTDLPESAEKTAVEAGSWDGVNLEERAGGMAIVEASALVAAAEAAGYPGLTGPTDADRLLGEALHSALEVWQPQTDPSAVWMPIADEYGLSESDTQRGLRLLHRFSEHEIVEWMRRFPCDREVELFGKREGRWVSGRADLVVYTPHEIRVVDYKLSVSSDNEAAYSEQLRVYGDLLSRRFRSTPVKGYIFDLSRSVLVAVASEGAAPEKPRA